MGSPESIGLGIGRARFKRGLGPRISQDGFQPVPPSQTEGCSMEEEEEGGLRTSP